MEFQPSSEELCTLHPVPSTSETMYLLLSKPGTPNFRNHVSCTPSSKPCTLDTVYPGYRVPWIPCTLDTVHPGYRVPWIPCTLDTVYPGYRVPWIPCSLDTVYPGYRVPWILCTLDTVYPGYHVPWIPCTLDTVYLRYRVQKSEIRQKGGIAPAMFKN